MAKIKENNLNKLSEVLKGRTIKEVRDETFYFTDGTSLEMDFGVIYGNTVDKEYTFNFKLED